jgi:hypothetical protein
VQFNGGKFSSLFGIMPDHPALDYGGAIETVVRWVVLNGCPGVLKFGTEPTLDLDMVPISSPKDDHCHLKWA